MPAFTVARAGYIDTRAAERNFALTAGDATSLVFTVIASDTHPTPAPVNITSATVTFRVRRRGCRSTEFEKSVGSGVALTTPASGVLTVTLAEADTVDLDPGLFAWQLRITLASAPSVMASGTLRLRGLLESR